ncbi:MAG TPA: dynamin family protein [Candidatus Elarobacter sp.]|nr:dynamin family protein [Candidatus Elarobacter sp.]
MNDPLEKYRAARDDVAACLDELRELIASDAVHRYGGAEDADALARTVGRLRDGHFVLAVVGEFSSGKSFLLNALLGKVEFEERPGGKRIAGLLATDINPSTATITELAYSPDESATAVYASGREERVPLGRLARFVAVGEEGKLHDATAEEDSGAPVLVRVAVDSAFLKGGFVVADTPGLASINPAHRRATLSYLPGADAVLYLIDTQQPFTEGDASFLGIVRRYIESVFIVQTKIDLWRIGESGGTDGAPKAEAWQAAAQRIVAQATKHAPGTPVFPLSAREYAEGLLRGDEALIAQSRFHQFLGALDASLVATTGRSRLRRAAAEARRAATRAADALAFDAAALETPLDALRAQRDAVAPALDAFDAAASAASARLDEAGTSLAEALRARGAEMRAALARTLVRAFDIADVARLRDRAKLHILVDDVLAAAVGRFAADAAESVAKRLRDEAKSASASVVAAARGADRDGALAPLLDAVEAERLPITESAAAAFGADASSGTWSTDLETGLRSSIVLGALGGPAVGLVDAIARRFSAVPPGAYMKREMLADLDTGVYPAFDADLEAYVGDIASRVETIARGLGASAAALAPRVRAEALGPLDRALVAHAPGADRSAAAREARRRAEAARALATRIETRTEAFARESRAERAELADPSVPLDPHAGREQVAPDEHARFDPRTYEHGLRPERWRVPVIGAFKRGKSSLINAIAGSRVLADEGADTEMTFPVHVRYGEQHRAYCLGDDAGWNEIPLDEALGAAARTPVLIETPWSLPRELVLVHTPAFDSGVPLAAEIVAAAASAGSEILALFSRQLSDRELETYGRIAESGKPMTFVHTMADHEDSSERRNVVMLADRYLRERAIVPQRIFTTSTLEYRQAREAGRAPAGWNELIALRATLEAHAEEHMARLARGERERAEAERLAKAVPRPEAARPSERTSFLGRLFRR